MTDITIDFETFYSDKYSLGKMQVVPYVRDKQFKIHGMGIKVEDGETQYFTHMDDIGSRLHDCFSQGNASTLIAHNTPFEGLVIKYHFGLTPAVFVDTQSMSRGCFPGYSSSLKQTAINCFPDGSIRKGDELALSKGHRDLTEALEEILKGYCINDVDVTRAVYNLLKGQYSEEELYIQHMFCRMYCDPVLKLNKTIVRNHLAALELEREAIIERARILIGDENIPKTTSHFLGSPKLFPTFVESLGIRVPTKISARTGKPTPAFAKSDLAFQKLQAAYPEYKDLWVARLAVKSSIEITRSKTLLESTLKSNLLPVPLIYSGADNTHRASGTGGINLQNLGRTSPLRYAIEAPAHFIIVVTDSSNIEARMLCVIARQDDVTEMFRQGIDTYCVMAEEIYGRVINKKDNPDERFVGKVARLSLGYNAGGPKFGDTLRTGAAGQVVDISHSEANRIVYEVFRPANQKIVDLWETAESWIEWMANPKSIDEPLTHMCLEIGHKKITLPSGMALRFPKLRQVAVETQYGEKHQWQYWGGKHWVGI